ncbi:MAG: cytochrome b N-terminal domain-containing protein [Polyangiales bacterium]
MIDEDAAPAWLEARYPTSALWRRLANARVDGRGAALGVLGALCGLLLAVEAATGALLALYYRPDRAAARASVQRVVTRVEFGELVRSLHAWGSHLLVAFVFALVGAALAAGHHRRPHELAWWALVVAWFAALASAFTGAILPWTARASLDAAVAAGALGRLPLAGPWLRAAVFGAGEPGDLLRAFGLHVGALPALWAVASGALALHGLARLSGDAAEGERERVFPTVALRAAGAASATFGVLVALAATQPAALGPAPSADGAMGSTRPSWFVAPLDAALRATPAEVLGAPGATVVVTLAAMGFVGALALPLVDRGGGRLGQWCGLAVYALVLGGMALALLR